MSTSPRPEPGSARSLAIVLLVAAGGLLGALGTLDERAGAGRAADPVALLAWLSIYALPAGWLVRGLGPRLVPFGIAAPGAWMAVLALVDERSALDLPTPLWAALVWSGAFAAGHGLAGLLGPASGTAARTWGGAGVLLLLGGLLAGLPGAGGAAARPWPPAAARRLLDLSPASVVIESAGVDWMRHPALYDPVGTDRFLRRPHRGALAGPVALVLGCLLAAGARLRGGRRPSTAAKPTQGQS
jgi:hypothetical protein